MAENERKDVKLTIEFDGKTQIIPCEGIAGVAFNTEGNSCKVNCMLIGNMSTADLIPLHKATKELLKQIETNIVQSTLGE